MHTTAKEKNGAAHPCYQLSSEKRSIHYALLRAMFSPLYTALQIELFKKHLCNQSSHYEKFGPFLL